MSLTAFLAAAGVTIIFVVAVSAQSAPCPPGVEILPHKLTCGATFSEASHLRRSAKLSGAALKSTLVVTPAET